MTIHYRISPIAPGTHYFRIRLRVELPGSVVQSFALPAWIPGSYMIRDFARNIVRFEVRGAADDVSYAKTDKQTWRVTGAAGELELSYDVYAWDLSVRGAHLDQTHAFFNGTSVFLRAVGREDEPCEVEVAPPEGKPYLAWRLATTLPAVDVDERGFGRYRAENYDALIDHPVEMGTFDLLSFDVDGVEHRMAITGRQGADKARIATDLARICRSHTALFDGSLPVERYLFLTTVVGDGYGGLEHRDSTALLCRRDDLPRPGLAEPDAGYRRFLALCSHEYFHLWNVKRIRPQVLKAADLSREVHTELLWAFEGITSYYDELALVRAGCISAEAYLAMLAETVTRVRRNPGRLRQSVAESSFDAWTRFYKQDENAPNAIVSYYAKGALVALGLDVALRVASDDRTSLDDLMRALWLRYGQRDVGVPEDGVEAVARELGGDNLAAFFAAWVHGTAELPLAEWFAYLGVGMRLRTQKDTRDLGGGRTAPDDDRVGCDIGVRYEAAADGVKVTQVIDGGAAAEAGIAAGDVLVALDGLRLSAAAMDERVSRLPVGVGVEVHLFRRDELMRIELSPQPAPEDTCELWLLDGDALDDACARRRDLWLGQAS